jgi:hypothetical protein
MLPLLWLAVAVAAAVAAYIVAWPAWIGYRSRESRDDNAERYLAWRGRARRSAPTMREGMTGDERRRVVLGVVLALVALAALIAFFATT